MHGDGPTDRRQFERFDACLIIGIDDHSTFLGQSVNINAAGIYIETALRPAINTYETLTFSWGRSHCIVRARVVRHTPHGVAFEFVEVDGLARRILHELRTQVLDSSGSPPTPQRRVVAPDTVVKPLTPRADRFSATLNAYEVPQGHWLGRTLNISTSGLYLVTDRRPCTGSSHEITLGPGEGIYLCQVGVARLDDAGVGLRFLSPSNLDHDTLRWLTQQAKRKPIG